MFRASVQAMVCFDYILSISLMILELAISVSIFCFLIRIRRFMFECKKSLIQLGIPSVNTRIKIYYRIVLSVNLVCFVFLSFHFLALSNKIRHSIYCYNIQREYNVPAFLISNLKIGGGVVVVGGGGWIPPDPGWCSG